MSTRTSSPDILSEGQRRHLTAALSRIERLLREVVGLARGNGAGETLLLRKAHDLPPDFGSRILAPIADAAATLAQIVTEFDLQPFPTSQLRTARALVLACLVEVEDTASRNLRGYGAVSLELTGRLDPLLERLHQHLAEIHRALPGENDGGQR